MPISFSAVGDFRRTERALKKMSSTAIFATLDSAGAKGVAALRANTPVDSGATAAAWGYKVERGRGGATITWTNSNRAGSAPLAIMLQYGHGTGTGGYVAGRDFINPAMRPIFDQIADEVWKAVTSA